MDITLIVLVVLLIVAIVGFVAALRSTNASSRPAPASAAATPAPGLPPAGASSSSAGGERRGGPEWRGAAPTIPPQQAQSPGSPFTAPPGQAQQDRPAGTHGETYSAHTQATFVASREQPEASLQNAPASPAHPEGSPSGERAPGHQVRAHDAQPDSGAAVSGQPEAATAPSADGTATAAEHGSPGSLDQQTETALPALELVPQPQTRSGRVGLMATPQRLPYRMAELAGEQRQLEEALAVARRRIEEIELGDDPGSVESRVRLEVLRQDLAQKQERLREILFLQDGYRWLQQRMAPERALREGQPAE